jgi:hypothetical protein
MNMEFAYWESTEECTDKWGVLAGQKIKSRCKHKSLKSFLLLWKL